jgi:hypothetical protein
MGSCNRATFLQLEFEAVRQIVLWPSSVAPQLKVLFLFLNKGQKFYFVIRSSTAASSRLRLQLGLTSWFSYGLTVLK